MSTLADKIKQQISQLGPRGMQVFVGSAEDGLLLVAPDCSCIEIKQTAWHPLCKWNLAEYRPGKPPVSHIVDCEWAILTWLQLRWLSRSTNHTRRNPA